MTWGETRDSEGVQDEILNRLLEITMEVRTKKSIPMEDKITFNGYMRICWESSRTNLNYPAFKEVFQGIMKKMFKPLDYSVLKESDPNLRYIVCGVDFKDWILVDSRLREAVQEEFQRRADEEIKESLNT